MIGKMLKLMRMKRKLKQSELAKKLNVSSSTIAMYETEARMVTLGTAKDIAEICNFEIQFVDKSDNKIYRFEDVERLDTDTRIRKQQ